MCEYAINTISPKNDYLLFDVAMTKIGLLFWTAVCPMSDRVGLGWVGSGLLAKFSRGLGTWVGFIKWTHVHVWSKYVSIVS